MDQGFSFIELAKQPTSLTDDQSFAFVNTFVSQLVNVAGPKNAYAILFPLCSMGSVVDDVRVMLQSTLFSVVASIFKLGFDVVNVLEMIKNNNNIAFTTTCNVDTQLSRYTTEFVKKQNPTANKFNVPIIGSVELVIHAPSSSIAAAIANILKTPLVNTQMDLVKEQHLSKISPVLRKMVVNNYELVFKTEEAKRNFDDTWEAIIKAGWAGVYDLEFLKVVLICSMSDDIYYEEDETRVKLAMQLATEASYYPLASVHSILNSDEKDIESGPRVAINCAAKEGIDIGGLGDLMQRQDPSPIEVLSEARKVLSKHRELRWVDIDRDEGTRELLVHWNVFFQAAAETYTEYMIYEEDSLNSNCYFPGVKRLNDDSKYDHIYYGCWLQRKTHTVRNGSNYRVKTWVTDNDANLDKSILALREATKRANCDRCPIIIVRLCFYSDPKFIVMFEQYLRAMTSANRFVFYVSPQLPHEPVCWLAAVQTPIPNPLKTILSGLPTKREEFTPVLMARYVSHCEKRGVVPFRDGAVGSPNIDDLVRSHMRDQSQRLNFFLKIDYSRRITGLVYRQMQFDSTIVTRPFSRALKQLNGTFASTINKQTNSVLKIGKVFIDHKALSQIQLVAEKEVFKQSGRAFGDKTNIKKKRQPGFITAVHGSQVLNANRNVPVVATVGEGSGVSGAGLVPKDDDGRTKDKREEAIAMPIQHQPQEQQQQPKIQVEGTQSGNNSTELYRNNENSNRLPSNKQSQKQGGGKGQHGNVRLFVPKKK